ncbi:metal-sensitive transcriptional regulator [candidate division WWE3 bacterium]|jgi:DNA-binding FrmR family transcriptional regulator|uniref:Metal-sensitive transcriptional regulator n=1 Tax=candidate division WWE3 bacterium TaxID=2053526 RepID=A0A3A4ZGU7_UNCKA|nr:MAG: metal-sensitive transcriptional regulator [candidate division WWE3 bacterium]
MPKKNSTKKERACHRLRIIQGHINSIEKMVENDEYCLDILHQSLAVQKALKKFDMFIMEDHLKYCVVQQAKDGEESKIVSELLSIYNFK